MVPTVTELLNGHSSAGLREGAFPIGPVAAAVVARLMDWKGGLHILLGLRHLQKLMVALPPQQKSHTPQHTSAHCCCFQAGGDPGHWRHREPGSRQGLCGWGGVEECFCITGDVGSPAEPGPHTHKTVKETGMEGIAGKRQAGTSGNKAYGKRKRVCGSCTACRACWGHNHVFLTTQTSSPFDRWEDWGLGLRDIG
uniref:Uncharacterized protein DKFZp547P183 n=1 Tax=Homo sapiens TaxID=9606 RepID=Q68CW3_HUMAN|nr:hypothetical protein [Homo sapiens]